MDSAIDPLGCQLEPRQDCEVYEEVMGRGIKVHRSVRTRMMASPPGREQQKIRAKNPPPDRQQTATPDVGRMAGGKVHRVGGLIGGMRFHKYGGFVCTDTQKHVHELEDGFGTR